MNDPHEIARRIVAGMEASGRVRLEQGEIVAVARALLAGERALLKADMGMFSRWRVQRLDCILAGLRAKLKASHELIKLVAVGSYIPGSLVYDMSDLPRKIAELEERRRQISGGLGPNAADKPRAEGESA